MYKRKRAGNTITRKINSTKDTAAKADKNHYISNSYLEGFIPIDTEYFTASSALKTFALMALSPQSRAESRLWSEVYFFISLSLTFLKRFSFSFRICTYFSHNYWL